MNKTTHSKFGNLGWGERGKCHSFLNSFPFRLRLAKMREAEVAQGQAGKVPPTPPPTLAQHCNSGLLAPDDLPASCPALWINPVVYSTNMSLGASDKDPGTKQRIGEGAALTAQMSPPPTLEARALSRPAPQSPPGSFAPGPGLPASQPFLPPLRGRDVSRHLPRLLPHGVGRPGEAEPA